MPKKIENMNNVEIVKYIMEIGGRTGAMKQIFIMDAIYKHVDAVIADEENIIKEYEKMLANKKMPMINYYAWIDSAKEINEILKQRDDANSIKK